MPFFKAVCNIYKLTCKILGDMIMNNKTKASSLYDQVMWSQLCSLEIAGEDYWSGGFDISIVSKDGKYGLIYTQHQYDSERQEVQYIENSLCDCKFDSIHNLQIIDASGCFVYFSGGKCGLLKLRCFEEIDDFIECTYAVPCIYDFISTVDRSDNILLCYQGADVRYYNLSTEALSSCYSSIEVEQGIAICETDGRFSLIDTRTDDSIYCGEENEYLEYCCRYRNGMVFKESHGEEDLNDLADIKEDACLLFYDFKNKRVYKTETYHNLKMFLIRCGFAVHLAGFAYERDNISHVVCGKEKVFSQADIKELCI